MFEMFLVLVFAVFSFEAVLHVCIMYVCNSNVHS